MNAYEVEIVRLTHRLQLESRFREEAFGRLASLGWVTRLVRWLTGIDHVGDLFRRYEAVQDSPELKEASALEAVSAFEALGKAARVLPCTCEGVRHHSSDCPAHYRPRVARLLLEVAS